MIETAFSRESFMIMEKLQMSLIQRVINKNKKRLSSKMGSDVEKALGCKFLFPHLVFTGES